MGNRLSIFFISSQIIAIDDNLFSFILFCSIMWADPRSVIEMVASVTISGGYFPARSFHPIHFISLFLFSTLFTIISFRMISKQFSQWVKLFPNDKTKGIDILYKKQWSKSPILKINWERKIWQLWLLQVCILQDIYMIKGGEASCPVQCLLEQRRAIIFWGGIRPFYCCMECITLQFSL